MWPIKPHCVVPALGRWQTVRDFVVAAAKLDSNGMIGVPCRGKTVKERRLDLLLLGLVPHWVKDPTIGNKLINARAESAWSLPAFRSAFRLRRCLVPAAGFYEWKKTSRSSKQPYYISPKVKPMFALAGLWEGWKVPTSGEWLHTFTILTCPPNNLVSTLHDRMPVILQEPSWPAWLGEVETTQDTLRRLIVEPYPTQSMTAYPVSTRVNSVRNDDAGLIDQLR